MKNLFAIFRRIRPMDTITVAYLLWVIVAIILGKNKPSTWGWCVALNISAIVLILVAALNRDRLSRSLRIVYDWYPIWGIGIVFEMLHGYIQILTDRWYDPVFLAADVKLFSTIPSAFFERFYSKPLNELVMLGYFSYYFLPYMIAVPLYRRTDKRAFYQTAAGIFLSFLPCLVLFLIFPAQSPRLYYAQFRNVPLEGYIITAIEHRLVSFGGLCGGAFPSSHCAVAVAVLLQAWRHHRKMFYLFLFFVPLLSLATVYGWYHYAVDVFAGWLIGVIAVIIIRYLYPCNNTR